MEIRIEADEAAAAYLLGNKTWEDVKGDLPKYVTEEILYETAARLKEGYGMGDAVDNTMMLSLAFTVLKTMTIVYKEKQG